MDRKKWILKNKKKNYEKIYELTSALEINCRTAMILYISTGILTSTWRNLHILIAILACH